ncbi:MAG: hypothetical protein ACOVQE_10080 [Chitinophagaceae bacterium]
MRNFYLFSLLLLLAFTANAQFEKGQKLVGPSIRFNFNNQNTKPDVGTEQTNKVYGVNLLVSNIKMKTQSVGWGYSAGWGIQHQKVNNGSNSSKTTNNNFTVGVVRRQYINLIPKLFVFIDAGLETNWGKGKTTFTSNNNNSESTNNQLGTQIYASPGVSFFLSKKLLLDAQLNQLAAIGYVRNSSNNNGFKNTNESVFANSNIAAGSLLNSFNFSLKWVL